LGSGGNPDVRFTPESGHDLVRRKCLLLTQSGHRLPCGGDALEF
jgi:hypothetical protein